MNLQASHSFSSVAEMDAAVSQHIYFNAKNLSSKQRKILKKIASHAFNPIGTARLKASTIAIEVDCNIVTVYRAIKKLSLLGILEVRVGKKLNGIQGANFYTILPCKESMIERVQERKKIEREIHGNTRKSSDKTKEIEVESFNSFNRQSKSFVSNVNTYSACFIQPDLKQLLQEIYQPKNQQENIEFEELCKIGFGRLKQYVADKKIPYLQMQQIVLTAMQQLVRKQNVKNKFAMYSAMIKRQANQLFEQPIVPRVNNHQMSDKKEIVPDWFYKRDEQLRNEETTEVDFEKERQKILKKLNQN